jgi:hypothetical protein
LAAAGWESKGRRGVFPDDTERVAAIIGMDVALVARATTFWESEGWIKREEGTLYLPWMTRAAAEKEAGEKAAEERARSASMVRWSERGPNKVLFDSRRNPHAIDEEPWPRDPVGALCDIWNAKFGAGAASGDEIAGHMKVVRKAGASWPEVRESFERYVTFTEARYASPGSWRKRWRTFLASAPDLDQHTLDVASSLDRQARSGGFEHVTDIVKKGGPR